MLDKVGVDPQVKRIGKYKSAGDQLLRKDMSEPQAEQLGAILDDIYEEFLTTVSAARGKTKEASQLHHCNACPPKQHTLLNGCVETRFMFLEYVKLSIS